MTMLRWYDVEQLQAAARILKQRLEGGSSGWLEFAMAAKEYILRDERSAYWFLDPSTGRWYRYDQGGWQPAEISIDKLEGSQTLADSGVLSTVFLTGLEDPFAGKESWQPLEVMEILVRKAEQDYRTGRFSSTDVELLLGRLFLLDQQARFWTIGINSGQWYRYADQSWVLVGHSPDPMQLIRWLGGRVKCEQCGLEVDNAYLCPNCGALMISGIDHLDPLSLQRVYRFLLLGAGTLPEPVSPPWEPPEDFSGLAAGARCEVCRASSLPGSHFCGQCGARLGCLNCGAFNPVGSRFCSSCGMELVSGRS